MSGYHKNCNSSDNQLQKKKKPSKKNLPLPPLTSKPFCDCEYCECKDCPDILKMMAITVTETTCLFGPNARKRSKCNVTMCETSLQPQRQSVLDVLNPERACDCEVMARAMRSNLHTNLGLSQLREAAEQRNSEQDPDNTNPPE